MIQSRPHSKKAHLISNSKSGLGSGNLLLDLARKLCKELGFELILHESSDPDSIDLIAKKTIQTASASNDLAIAAGGDGLIRSVTQWAQLLKKNMLEVVTMKPLTKWGVLQKITRGLFKMIETKRILQTVSLDGEFFQMSSPFQIRALPETLNVVLPPKKV